MEKMSKKQYISEEIFACPKTKEYLIELSIHLVKLAETLTMSPLTGTILVKTYRN